MFKLDGGTQSRRLVEVVVSPNFPHLGKTVRDSNFRNHYGAAIIAIARDGEQLKTRIGDVELRPGDTLLLETRDQFVNQQRYKRDFLYWSVKLKTPAQWPMKNVGFRLPSWRLWSHW